MITGVDHLVIGVRDLAAATPAYAAQLGRAPSWRSTALDGEAQLAAFGLENITIELLAPSGPGALSAALEEGGEGPLSLALAASDLDALHARLAACGFAPEPITPGESTDEATGARRAWRRTRLPKDRAGGLRLFIIEPAAPHPRSTRANEEVVSGLAALTLETPALDAAAALLEAGLDLPRMGPAASFRAGDIALHLAPGPMGRLLDPVWR